jgi:uncharacterized protein YbaR (Trm112 family)
MKLKLMDIVTCPRLKVSGQVVRIRHSVATIDFVTGVRIRKKLNKIVYTNKQWRIDD